MNGEKVNVRGIYGRGYFDGLRACGINTEDDMNPARLTEIESGLTGIARKVLEAVPMAEAWATSKIQSEMARMGHGGERRIIDGALASMKEKGLIREPQPGHWIRTASKPKLEQVVKVNPSIIPKEPPLMSVKTEGEPLVRLEMVAKSMRQLSKMATDIANEIEDIAVGVDENIKRVVAEGGKLKQLQELLKSIQ